jgi:hypothetical protein
LQINRSYSSTGYTGGIYVSVVHLSNSGSGTETANITITPINNRQRVLVHAIVSDVYYWQFYLTTATDTLELFDITVGTYISNSGGYTDTLIIHPSDPAPHNGVTAQCFASSCSGLGFVGAVSPNPVWTGITWLTMGSVQVLHHHISDIYGGGAGLRRDTFALYSVLPSMYWYIDTADGDDHVTIYADTSSNLNGYTNQIFVLLGDGNDYLVGGTSNANIAVIGML